MAQALYKMYGQVVKEGLAGLTAMQIQAAVKESRRTGMPALFCLVRLGFVDETVLLRAIAEALGVEFVNLGEFSAPPEAVRLIEAKQAIRYQVLPTAAENGRFQTVVHRVARESHRSHRPGSRQRSTRRHRRAPAVA